MQTLSDWKAGHMAPCWGSQCMHKEFRPQHLEVEYMCEPRKMKELLLLFYEYFPS